MIDYTVSERLYPTPSLPLLPDVAELACRQRDAYPGQPLAGATIDVTAAYNQCALTVNAAKMTATKINVPNGVGGWMIFIVMYLVGIFGCSTAGNAYCVCAETMHELHNAKKGRSLTYIDDGMLIDTQENIQSSVNEYVAHVVVLCSVVLWVWVLLLSSTITMCAYFQLIEFVSAMMPLHLCACMHLCPPLHSQKARDEWRRALSLCRNKRNAQACECIHNSDWETKIQDKHRYETMKPHTMTSSYDIRASSQCLLCLSPQLRDAATSRHQPWLCRHENGR